jgi:hypothetical protein
MAATATIAQRSRTDFGNRIQACRVPVLKVEVDELMSFSGEDDDGQLAVVCQYGKPGTNRPSPFVVAIGTRNVRFCRADP